MRKIIHVDMDCFYAAIEIRDNPLLANKPVAVGGAPDTRGVLCTCNYIARQYGLHSAMPTATALRLCKDLVLLPVDMPKYQSVAARIKKIFNTYTAAVEPLSLDEAYLDVSEALQFQGSATRIAESIRARIWEEEELIASAGVASNKLLAKIASGWKKPNGLFVIHPKMVSDFIRKLPIEQLHGVGKVTTEKLHKMHIKTCEDLQRLGQLELEQQLGKLGKSLFDQCRGIDNRPVIASRLRKSLSVEHTFAADLKNIDIALGTVHVLYEKLLARMKEENIVQPIKNQFIKIKYSNFRLVSAETIATHADLGRFRALLEDTYAKYQKSIRLLGLGVHFREDQEDSAYQHSLF